MVLQLKLGAVLDRHDALAIVDVGRHGVEQGRLARTGAAGNEDIAARATTAWSTWRTAGGMLPISTSRSMLIGTRENLRIESVEPSIDSGGQRR